MNLSRILTPLLMLSCLLVTSCKVSLPHHRNGKNLRGALAGHRLPDPKQKFTKVNMGHRISAADLRPDGSTYRIGAGDIVTIELAQTPDTTATTMVMPDGKIYYDIAPGVPAVGKSVPELEEALAVALKDYYQDPVVNIFPVKVNSRTYSIMGQVLTPGVYELTYPTTVLDSVSAAGGIRSSEVASRTENLADLGRATVIRNGRFLPVDFQGLIERGDMSQNVYLRPGDYVYLPAKGTEKVYVLGNAIRPRAVPYSSDLTFVKAIASAGGPAISTFRSGILVIRGATTPTPEVLPVDLGSVLRGGTTDFYLQPGDVIWMPKAPWQKLTEYAEVAIDAAVSTISLQEFADDSGSIGSRSTLNALGDRISVSGNTINIPGANPALGISTGPESTTITVD